MMSLFLFGWSIARTIHLGSSLGHRATPLGPSLAAIPTCHSYLPSLPAIPTCHPYLPSLPAIPTCHRYLPAPCPVLPARCCQALTSRPVPPLTTVTAAAGTLGTLAPRICQVSLSTLSPLPPSDPVPIVPHGSFYLCLRTPSVNLIHPMESIQLDPPN